MNRLLLIFLSVVLFFSCKSGLKEDNSPTITAEAQIISIEKEREDHVGNEFYTVKKSSFGTATFTQKGNAVTLKIEVKGMSPNSVKAAHIHNGSLEAPRRHWNQNSLYAFCNKTSMGKPWSKVFAGDIGNIQVDKNGNGSLTLTTDLWALNSGDAKDILDKVIIIHDKGENFEKICDPTYKHDHNLNPKIGGGIIRLTTDIPQKTQLIQTQFPDFTICK